MATACRRRRTDATRETPLDGRRDDQRDAREGQARLGGVADGLVVPLKPGNAGGGKEPWFEEDAGRSAGQETGVNLQAPESVQKLQSALHAKAKGESGYRFYALYDKVYREDILHFAYRLARSNGGAPGVDGQDFADIEAYGVERWLGELAQALREKTYRTQAVRRVWIPKRTARAGRWAYPRYGIGWHKRRR